MKNLECTNKQDSDEVQKIITDKETELIERLVKVLGYKYIYECDAPRGGKLGDYIKLGRKNTTIVNKIVESGLY